uniref:Transposase n=1 Tax=Globodera rostochiensis TaxID=31243 RepID=A0A914I185_GLORO
MATNRRYTQKEYEAKIKQKLGYTILTIKRWKRNFGIRANPRLRDIDIAKMLHIGARTLYSWRHQFEDKGVQMQGSDSFLNGKGSH